MNVAIILSGRIVTRDDKITTSRLKDTFSKYKTTYFISINNQVHDEEYTERFMKEMKIDQERVNIETTILPNTLETYKKKKESDYHRTYSMYYHNKKGFDMITEYSRKHDIKFDIVVKYRVDINNEERMIDLMLCETEKETVCIPEGMDFGGTNDQIAYGDIASMYKYTRCVDNIIKICESGVVFHPERLLKEHLKMEKVNISRFKYKYKLKSN